MCLRFFKNERFARKKPAETVIKCVTAKSRGIKSDVCPIRQSEKFAAAASVPTAAPISRLSFSVGLCDISHFSDLKKLKKNPPDYLLKFIKIAVDFAESGDTF